MDFGIVLAGFAEYVHHRPARVLGLFGPVGDFHYGLVACVAPFEFVARDEYVAGQEFGIGAQERHVFVDLQRADKHLVFLFDDFDYLSFRLLPAAAGCDVYFHPVAVERVHGIALGHEDGFVVIVGDDAVLAVGTAHKGAGCNVVALQGAVFSGFGFEDVAVEGHFGQHHSYGALCLGLVCPDAG